MTQTRHAMNNRLGLQVFVFLVLALYFSFFWHKGQTLAMKTWHLKITNLNGDALSRQQALIRYVLAWIWFVPPLVLTWLQAGSSLKGLGAGGCASACRIKAASTNAGNRGPKRDRTRAVFVRSLMMALGPMDFVM